jgi:hypothetical protein
MKIALLKERRKIAFTLFILFIVGVRKRSAVIGKDNITWD